MIRRQGARSRSHSPHSQAAKNQNRRLVESVLLLALSLCATLVFTQFTAGPTLVRNGSPSSSITSFAYSGQWGSYGGPIMPNGVTVDSSGNVYVADAKNYAMFKFASSGSLITSWGTKGTSSGQFNGPQGIT